MQLNFRQLADHLKGCFPVFVRTAINSPYSISCNQGIYSYKLLAIDSVFEHPLLGKLPKIMNISSSGWAF